MKLPITGTTDPAAPRTPPSKPAPIALNAALPGLSPRATDSAKSSTPPMIGTLNLLKIPFA